MRVLLLSGTGEGRELARLLADRSEIDLTVSHVDAGQAGAPDRARLRTGGFGGDTGFEAYLSDHRIEAVLDATHPFAARVSRRSARICGVAGVPYAQVVRPGWRAGDGDRWSMVGNEAEAAALIPAGATAFLATGRMGLEDFGTMPGRRVLVRQIGARPPEPVPFAEGSWIVGHPPFTVAEEVALFRDLGVDWLVLRDAGGDASRSKLDAARVLGVRVAMIRRPDVPDAPRFETVAGAVAWVEALT